MFMSLIPWTILQGYKLTKIDVGPESTESFGCNNRTIPDPVMGSKLEVGSDGPVLKAEDNSSDKIVSWQLDSFTTLGEQVN